MSDLISRQDAIEALEHDRDTMPYEYSASDAIITIKALPSAQLPPYIAEIEEEYKKAVRAQWIHKPLAKALYEVWKKHDREDVNRHE